MHKLQSLSTLTFALLFNQHANGYVNPSTPAVGWTYHVEASKPDTWPGCPFRFLSFDSACSVVNLWDSAGENQEFTLEQAPGDAAVYLKTGCGKYVSYSASNCDDHSITLSATPSPFLVVPSPSGGFEFFLQLIGRDACEFQWLSFAGDPCPTSGPDFVDIWNRAGANQLFRFFPVRTNALLPLSSPVSDGPCADPFIWMQNRVFHLICTGGAIPLQKSSSPSSVFHMQGDALSSASAPPPEWLASGNRWAPEVLVVNNARFYFFAFRTIQLT